MEIASDEGLRVPQPVIPVQSTQTFRRTVQVGEIGAFRWNPRASALEPCELRVANLDVSEQFRLAIGA
jgi:hypothetical protein